MTEGNFNVGKEPGGWELYRGIERIEKAVREQSSNFVPIGVYNVTVQSLTSQIADVKREQAELEQKQAEQATAKIKQDEDLRRLRAQQWFAVGTIVLAAVLAFAGNIILNVVNGGGGG